MPQPMPRCCLRRLASVLLAAPLPSAWPMFPVSSRQSGRGRRSAIFGAGNVGAAVTNFLAPFVLLAWGWQAVAQVSAGALAVMAVVFWFCTSDDPAFRLRLKRSHGSKEPLAGACSAEKLQVWRFALYSFLRLWWRSSSVPIDEVNAIINCHLATGRIGKPGMGPFSVTGQPNAMGGREVGGLANMLAAHMEIENPDHRDRVQRFWRSPLIADRSGLKAVDMFRAVGDGRIKALWIMATNPVEFFAGRDICRSCFENMPLRRGLGRVGKDRYGSPRSRRAARRRLGRKGRDCHQLRTPHFASAPVPAAPRRGAARLADHLRRGKAHGVRQRLFLCVAG